MTEAEQTRRVSWTVYRLSRAFDTYGHGLTAAVQIPLACF